MVKVSFRAEREYLRIDQQKLIQLTKSLTPTDRSWSRDLHRIAIEMSESPTTRCLGIAA